MTHFTVHTPASAPERSRPILESAQRANGFLPNLLAVLSESPTALEAYTTLSGIYGKSSFTKTEEQVVLHTASFENGCDYCMAAHSTISGKLGISEDVIAGLRDGAPVGDARLDALARFTRAVVQERGWAGDDAVAAFLAAGFTKEQVLEVVVGLALKTISNYSNHLASPPLDAAFEDQAWSRPATV